MKAPIIVVLIAGAVIAGGGAGLAVSLMTQDPDPTVTTSQHVDTETYDDRAVQDDVAGLRKDLGTLRVDVTELNDALMDARKERDALYDENTTLKEKIVALESQPADATPTSSGSSVDQDDPAYKAALKEAVKDEVASLRDAEREKKAAAAKKAQDREMKKVTDRAVKRLTDELFLAEYQQANIRKAIESFSTRMQNMKGDAERAQANGEEYDWREEWKQMTEEADTAIRGELDSTQQATYDDLVGDRGVTGLLWPSK